MLIPIGDQPNPRFTPWINYLLIAGNVAVFLLVTLPLSTARIDPYAPGAAEFLMHVARQTGQSPAGLLHTLSAYDWFVYQAAYRPADPTISGLFLSMFLHGGLAHLLGNMWFLWIFGDNVEYRLGRAGYLLAYLGTGCAAALFHGALSSDPQLPMLGASGAISGVLGCYFVWFPQNQVRMLLWLYFWVDVFLVPARLVLGFYLLIDNLVPLFFEASSGGVAHGAHVGGFLAGGLLAWLIDTLKDRGAAEGWRPVETEEERLERAPTFEKLQNAYLAGRHDQAAKCFFRLAPHEQARIEPEEIALTADWLTQQGHDNVALALLRQYLAARPRDRRTAPLHVRAGFLLLYQHNRPTDAYQHLRRALGFDPSPSMRLQVQEALAEIERRYGR